MKALNFARKNSLKRHLAKINRKYGVSLNEQNYRDVILKELESPPSLLDYFKRYMERNRDAVTLEWGCLMFLFMKADEEKRVPDIKRYYKLLQRYPANWLTEVSMAELEWRYYGALFKSKDRFYKALELKPNDAHCHYSLGAIYYLLGLFEKSVEHFKNAVTYHKNANNPSEVKARSLYNIAVYKIMEEHNYKQAEKLLNEALIEMPDYPQARQALEQIR